MTFAREYPDAPRVGVGAVILDGDRVLLVKRGQPPSQGKWSIPGGLVHRGERIEDAVRREVEEECGVQVRLLDLCGVIDRVRLDESQRCQTEGERKALKGTKFLLLKNRENLRDDEPAHLRALLRANRHLFVVHLLGEGLKHLWDYTYTACASRWFEGWYRQAIHTRIEPLKRFARTMKERLDGILAHCRHPISNGVLEGINNKVKVIKRIAYGFRDMDYFFLKIRGHFAGIGSQ